MTASSPYAPEPPAPSQPRRRHLRHLRRLLVWSAVFAALGAVAVVVLLEQTLRAPGWLRDRIEVRIESVSGGLDIEFGDVELVIHKGWRPRAALRDVAVKDAAGRPLLELSDIEASLAMRPLLRGRVQPKRITLSGAYAVLRRDAAGQLSLSFDGNPEVMETAPGLAPVIEQIDAVFAVPQLAALVDITLDALNLRYEDALSGEAWTVDAGTAQITREGQRLRLSGTLPLLTGGSYASVVEVNYTSEIGAVSAEFGLTLRDVPARELASQFATLAWLAPLRAPLSGALRGSVTTQGDLGPLNATLRAGVGALQPTDQTHPIRFERASAYFTVDPAEEVIQFDQITVVSDWVSGSAEGTTRLQGLAEGRPTGLTGQLRLTETRLNPMGLYASAVSLTGAVADFRLQLDPFTLTLGELFVSNRGSSLTVDGRLRSTEAGWQVAVDGRIDALSPERLVQVWPEGAKPKTRRWIAQNLSGGRLSDVNFALRAQPGGRPDVFIDFDFVNMAVRFMRHMPPITGAAGQASLIGERFVATATAGRVTADTGGALDISGSAFIIPDTSINVAAPAVTRLQARGGLTDLLSLLDRRPIEILRRSGLPGDLADGSMVFQGNIAWPLKRPVPPEEVEFYIDGLARDVHSDRLLSGQSVAAPSLRVTASADLLEIEGAGQLNAAPFRMRWQQPLGQPGAGSAMNGTLVLDPDLLAAFGVTFPPGTVSGGTAAEIDLTLVPGQPPKLDLQSDLRGLALSIPALGWSKPAGQSADLAFTAELSQPALIPEFAFSAPGILASGRLRTAPEGGLAEAEFRELRLGDWLAVAARLEGQGPGRPPRLRIDGGTLDLRSADLGGAAAAGPPIEARLDRVQLSEAVAITGLVGAFSNTGGLEGRFEGRVNGGTAVSGRVEPRDGGSAVTLLAEDAGGLLRDAGLVDHAHSGSFALTLTPAGRPGHFDGSLEIRDIQFRNAPAIAGLLNAMSLVGLPNELAGEGLVFWRVAARFALTPSRIILEEAQATGPALGLTMDGLYDIPGKMLNMQGLISPVYVINQIGEVFSARDGEGLFGFTYTLTGPAASPRVQVNPLSALMPGVLREVFRAPPPPEGSAEGTAPVLPPARPRPPRLQGSENR